MKSMGIFIEPYQDLEDENIFNMAVKNFSRIYVRIDHKSFQTQVNVGSHSSNWINVTTKEKLQEIVQWFKEKEYGQEWFYVL